MPNFFAELLPEGTGPGALRVVRAQDVREHDWYVGTYAEQADPRPGRDRRAQTSGSWAAKVRKRFWRPGTVALDGTNFHWRRNELVVIIPRESLPEEDWTGGSFMWAPGDLDRDEASA
ncbi:MULTISPECIES: hypothetical protein [Streptomyces]|uniref:hypothetical protein n=1 Tax=Streptomyces TaxID=1883 RepID=UPI00235DCE36|nr:hypothetical protein [Streptomyces sp. MMBL 11-1]WSU86116.1 hypothetical protein OG215_36255 [Streptomyces globisporus]